MPGSYGSEMKSMYDFQVLETNEDEYDLALKQGNLGLQKILDNVAPFPLGMGCFVFILYLTKIRLLCSFSNKTAIISFEDRFIDFYEEVNLVFKQDRIWECSLHILIQEPDFCLDFQGHMHLT